MSVLTARTDEMFAPIFAPNISQCRPLQIAWKPAVADLEEGRKGARAPLLVEYLQKIYKKMAKMGIQAILRDFWPPLSRIL